MKITASSFKLRANVPEGRKRFPISQPVSNTPPLGLSGGHVAGAVLYADRSAALVHHPRRGMIAEIGVGYGDFSEELLTSLQPLEFHAFDLFPWQPDYVLWGRPAWETLQGKSHHEFFLDRFATSIDNGQSFVHMGDSVETLADIPDQYFDMIYVDGDHSLEGVSRDAVAAARTLKPDGYLVFNDYVMFDHINDCHYGIVHVVNDMCVNQGWRVEYLALDAGMHCDICIRRFPGEVDKNVD